MRRRTAWLAGAAMAASATVYVIDRTVSAGLRVIGEGAVHFSNAVDSIIRDHHATR